MSIDILKIRNYEANMQAIDIAIPVLAIECAANPPIENYLDAYEDAVLKLIDIGLSVNGISKTLNTSESLTEEIISSLERKRYVSRKIGEPWKLTNDGEKYLSGEIEERVSENSQYGVMFVNAIKREVLPYFYAGDIGRINLYRGDSLPMKVTLAQNENITFELGEIKKTSLNKAYKAFIKQQNMLLNLEEEMESIDFSDIFDSLDSFDEEIEEETVIIEKDVELKGNMFIRALNRKPIKAYLHMRIVIDPTYPGGYRAESPFDMDGMDDIYFLKQLQWLERSEETYIEGRVFNDFINAEICKLSPGFNNSKKDYKVFLLENLPLLNIYKAKMKKEYDDMEKIYHLMQKENSLLEKENIVSNLSRNIVESLLNRYFKAIPENTISKIRKNAETKIRIRGEEAYLSYICKNAGLEEDALRWITPKYLSTILNRLKFSYGNSIKEKFINLLIIDGEISIANIQSFLKKSDVKRMYELVNRLNIIRRKVSHDTEDPFEIKDYDYYINNVFELINNLLIGLKEE